MPPSQEKKLHNFVRVRPQKMGNSSFRKNFPEELTLKIIACLAEPSSLAPFDSPLLARFDLGYFPCRNQASLTQILKVVQVNKHFLGLGQSFLLKTVHLRTKADVVAFHALTSPNAIMNSVYVKKLSLVFEADQEELPALFELCATILKHLSKLSKLDLAQFHPSVVPYVFDAANGPSIYNDFWNSIPDSLQHIIVQDATFVPFLFQPNHQYEDRPQVLDRFVEDHPNLETWCFDEWFDTIATLKIQKYWEIWRKHKVDFGNGTFPQQIQKLQDFAKQHISRLLKYCKSLQIILDPMFGDDVNDDPHKSEVWVLPGMFPRASYICSSHALYWPEDKQTTMIETFWAYSDRSFSQFKLNKVLTLLPCLSTFIYEAPTLYATDGTRHNEEGTWVQVSSPSLAHVVAFIPLLTHGFHEHVIKNQSGHSLLGYHSEFAESYENSLEAVHNEFAGLQDRERFPKLEKISLILDPHNYGASQSYPDIEMRGILENSLRDTFVPFARTGIRVTICWGTRWYFSPNILVLTRFPLCRTQIPATLRS